MKGHIVGMNQDIVPAVSSIVGHGHATACARALRVVEPPASLGLAGVSDFADQHIGDVDDPGGGAFGRPHPFEPAAGGENGIYLVQGGAAITLLDIDQQIGHAVTIELGDADSARALRKPVQAKAHPNLRRREFPVGLRHVDGKPQRRKLDIVRLPVSGNVGEAVGGVLPVTPRRIEIVRG